MTTPATPDMTSRDALLALADRCEQASGWDWDLDAKIAIGCNLYVLEKRDRDRFAWFYPTDGTICRRSAAKYAGHDGLPRYTASLDAALTLVPDGWAHGYRWNEKHKNAQAWCEFIPQAPFAPADLVSCDSGKCAAPALALCAAALRARANMENDNG